MDPQDRRPSLFPTCPTCGTSFVVKLSDEVVASLHGIAPPDPLYTLKQAQPMLGLGDRAMRQAIYEGELRASKLRTGRGRDAWHVSASAIREFRRKRGVE